jgi:hypothetical protein
MLNSLTQTNAIFAVVNLSLSLLLLHWGYIVTFTEFLIIFRN